MAIAPQRLGIGIRRYFTTEDRHPYDEVTWDLREARITNFRDGSVAFEQLDVASKAERKLTYTEPPYYPRPVAEALGQLIYTHYLYVFQVAGLILLVAMIGAIVLTLRHRPGVQRQRIAEQIGRKRTDVLAVKQVSSGAGAPVQ